MADIVEFEGATCADDDPNKILEAAKSGELRKVVVVGEDIDGAMYFAGSFSDIPEIAYLLDRAKDLLMSWQREDTYDG